jgi:hypothetical protein
MQLFQVLPLFLSLPQLSVLAYTETPKSPTDLQSKATNTPQLSSELVLQRNGEVASKLATAPPRGVRKMSADEGEKFFLDYWDFATLSPGNVSEQHGSDLEGFSPAHFVAQSYPFRPSYSLGSDTDAELLPRRDSGSAKNVFAARNFMCPLGTWACTSIGRSDRCCGSGETCEIVADTGHGTVGCCPSWKRCSGMIGTCESGYTACSQDLGGGCCIPGYDCVEGGCEFFPVP